MANRRQAWVALVVPLLMMSMAAVVNGSAPVSAASKTSLGPPVTMAEFPSAPPNYIFPLTSASYFVTTNTFDFSNLIFSPLYWFGTPEAHPTVDYSLSLAYPPTFSDNNTLVTIHLKRYYWSDGQPVTARDVIFWMNLVSAASDPNAPAIGSSSAPGPGWASAVPGDFPENIVAYRQTGQYTLTLQLNRSYNPTWYLYNELSQIHPIPYHAWDKLSASGPVGNYDASAEGRVALPNTTPASYVPANPGTASSGALGVAQFLNSQSQTLSTYDTNPLWQVVDGPFRLKEITLSGYLKLIPNSSYSGTSKPHISAFVELPFTSDAAEYTSVLDGDIDYGYLPAEDLHAAEQVKSRGYRVVPWFNYAAFFLNYNYTNTSTGPILKELYFRQAMQSLINQQSMIKDFLDGYGALNNGPVPRLPASKWVSPLAGSDKAYYSYDPARAAELLRQHGWHVAPGGTTYCAHPGSESGECGAGIGRGEGVSLTVLYPSGLTQITDELEGLESVAGQKLGIRLTLAPRTFGELGADMFGCTFSAPCQSWSMGYVDGYAYTYLPTGDQLFYCGSVDDAGDYCSAQNDGNVIATETAATARAEYSALYRYEDYLVKDLPGAWLPESTVQVSVVKKNLEGVSPQGAFSEIYPMVYSWHGHG